MADGVSADMAQIKKLAADLAGAGSRLRPVQKAVAAKAALNIKNDAKARILAQSDHRYIKQYPNSFSYDLNAAGYTVTVEIGPDKNLPQGALGNILEFGTSRNAPMPHLIPAFDAEIPKAETWLAQAAQNAVFGA